jgi:hypothetical protein
VVQQDPVVLVASRTKAVLLILVGAAMLVVFAFAPYDGQTMSLFGELLLWFMRLMAGAGMVAGAIRLIRPPRIEINSAGLIYITERRKFEFTWSEIGSFTYVKGDYLVSHVPGMIFINPSECADGAKKFPAIPGGWDISLAELTHLLNEARSRSQKC